MFLCLILLASSILAPGQSAPPQPHQAAAADAAAAGNGQMQVYADLMSEMNEFVEHVLAPLFTIGKCHKGMKEENVHVFGFDAFQRRCGSAVVLDRLMAQLRGLFVQHKEEEELKEKVKEEMDELIKRIRDRVYYHDVIEFEGKLYEMEEAKSRVGELEEEVKKIDYMEVDQDDYRQGRFKLLMELNQKAMAAFQERPSFDTAYSLVRIAEHSGVVSYVSWIGVQLLVWAMQTFKADLLVYDFVLKHEVEKKKKLEKKQSGHEHGPAKQEGHNAIVPHATKSGSKKRQDAVANV